MNSLEAISILLAAETDATVRDLDTYKEAEEKVFANEKLKALYQDEKAFYEQQEGMLSKVVLSLEAKARIKARLSEVPQQKMIHFSPRWISVAAVFALLLGGAWLVTSTIARTAASKQIQVASTGIPLDDLRNFLAANIDRGFKLDHRTKSPMHAVSWLTNHAGAPALNLPHSLQEIQSMGCKVLDWKGQKISLICMKQGKGQIIHLFVTQEMNDFGPGSEPLRATHRGYNNMTWEAENNTYLLFGHEKGQELDSLSI